MGELQFRHDESTSGGAGIGSAKFSPVLDSLRRGERRALEREAFIQFITDYVLDNGGPDSSGRAHPKVSRIQCEPLAEALDRATERGLNPAWRPYHFKGHYGTWSAPGYVDEVVLSKVSQVLADNFDNDPLKLVREVSADLLLEPLLISIEGRQIEVCTARAFSAFNRSPFRILSRFFQLTGDKEFDGLRPYHFQKSSQGLFHDQKILDEVLTRRLNTLLVEKFSGSLHRLVTETSESDLTTPFIDRLGSHSLEVSTRTLVKRFGASPYAMVRHYLSINEIDGYDDFRPYHMRVAPQGTFHDPAVVDELLTKKIDQLLQNKFGGDLLSLFTQTTMADLSSPLIETLAGHPIVVSMHLVCEKFKNSPFAMLTSYRDLRRIAGYDNLRPYHLFKAPGGTFQDPAIIDEVVDKKIRHLCRASFGGDMERLYREASARELFSHFPDPLGPGTISVSMSKAAQYFGNSPQAMLARHKQPKNEPLMEPHQLHA